MGDGPLIALRFALYADLLGLVGLAAFALYAPSAAVPGRRVALVLAGVGLVLAGLGMALLAAAMAGVGLFALDRETFAAIVWQTPTGTAWLVRLAGLVVAILAAAALRRAPGVAQLVLLGASASALGTLAWTGHGAAGDGLGGALHAVADIIHLLAGAVWIGGIAGLTALVLQASATRSTADVGLARRALEHFTLVGTLAVALVVLSGFVNTWTMLSGAGAGQVVRSTYVRLLAVKLALVVAMLGFAAINRIWLVPALAVAADPQRALRDLRRSLFGEGAAALAILALVASLGTLEPPSPGM